MEDIASDSMEKSKEYIRVADKMRTLCSRREYCSADILKKVTVALEGDLEKAKQIVAELIEEKYIDDLRYASAFARDKSSIAGWGEVKIRYMLSAKGISKGIISEALDSIDGVQASGRLEKLMETKARSLKDDPQAKLKMLRFGMGRGYSYEAVAEVTDKIMERWKYSED